MNTNAKKTMKDIKRTHEFIMFAMPYSLSAADPVIPGVPENLWIANMIHS